MNAIVEELLAGEKRQTGTTDMMLQLAEWAAASYARYDRAAVDRIAKAAAEAASPRPPPRPPLRSPARWQTRR
jgi:acetaldehyde dehydrogenase / alcohol dehydrogenase